MSPAHYAVATGANESPRLGCVAALVDALRAAAVPYCHWKSNEHLLAAVAGDTDLDVLFDESGRSAAVQVLEQVGFRRACAVWYRRYPHIEDYLCIDPASGRLVHVHAHFRLLVGEESVKSYRLPWEKEILDSRQWDEVAQFPAAEPGRELLLLLVRAAIKRRHPSLHRRLLHARSRASSASDERREFTWLKQRVASIQLTALAASLLGSHSVPAVEALYESGMGTDNLVRLYETAHLDRFLVSGLGTTRLRRALRWSVALGAVVSRRAGLIARPSRRRLIGGGLIVAVLGADGSGKSTLVKSLDAALSKKLDVERLYLGSGDGPSSLLRRPLVLLRGWRQRRRVAAGAELLRAPGSGEATRPGRGGVLRTCERVLWAVSLALEKRARVRAAARARARGKIVVTDRYPQANIEGYNDGPLLGDLAGSRWWPLRALSRWERSGYLPEQIAQPDVVLELIGSPRVLHERRPEMSMEAIIRKQEGILAIVFAPHVRVVRLDANASAQQVVTSAMVAVGAVLQGFHIDAMPVDVIETDAAH